MNLGREGNRNVQNFPSFGRGFNSHSRLQIVVDSVALPLLRLENGANWPEFWTQVGPKFYFVR